MADHIDAERAAFEAAWREYYNMPSHIRFTEFEDDKYAAFAVQDAWSGWQMARRTPSASIGEDGLPEVARAVIAELEKNSSKPHAPDHCHQVAGIWDMGNRPEIAGKPCEWCALWNKFKRLAAPPLSSEQQAEKGGA